jgi:hypothetical protein
MLRKSSARRSHASVVFFEAAASIEALSLVIPGAVVLAFLAAVVVGVICCGSIERRRRIVDRNELPF